MKNDNFTVLIPKGNSYCHYKSRAMVYPSKISSERLSREIGILIQSPIQSLTELDRTLIFFSIAMYISSTILFLFIFQTNNCSLHVSQMLSRFYPGDQSQPVLTRDSAPGLVIASGTLGVNLKSRLDLFVSSDGGVSWYKVSIIFIFHLAMYFFYL